MKTFIMVFTIILSGKIMASDMSKFEDARTAYKTLANGSALYVGKCSTHENYKNKYYQVTQSIIPYFQPNYNLTEEELVKKVSVLGPALLIEVKRHLQINSFSDIDDITVDKIQFPKAKNMNLIQLNIGIGGGNGMYLVFNRIQTNNIFTYELMSKTMDGDVQYCDSKVWLK